MKCTRYLTAGASVLAIAAIASLSASASAHTYYFPFKKGAAFRLDPNKPLAHVGPYEPAYIAPKGSKSGTWTDVTAKLPFVNGPWNPRQLTDGSVLILDLCTTPAQWYKLSPDKTGSYVNGTWSKIATMPTGYSPLFSASEVLTDGRFIVNGGEYNATSGNACPQSGDWTKLGALYDPAKDSWTTVNPPTGWNSIGDAQSVLLPDGSYMLADCCTEQEAIATISGTNVTWTSTGAGKADDDDEEGWANIVGGDVFSVDAWKLCNPGDNYETYDPSKGTWSSLGCTPDTLTITSTRELGPNILTPGHGKSGTIIAFSGNPTLGVNDIYDVAGNTWTSGPAMTYKGTIYDVADGPAATLPDGHVLVEASPSTFKNPSHFWDWSFNKKTGAAVVTQVSDPTEAPTTSSFEGNLMVLPTGQLIWDDSQTTPNEVSIYTDKGKPNKKWLPKVSSVSNKLKIGSTGNAISGTNFNGFDLGGQYGDDAQQQTNFPLVRITNTKSGDICYAKSYDFSTMGVWTTGTTNAVFDIPKSCGKGASTLQVVVNGIASAAVKVTLS